MTKTIDYLLSVLQRGTASWPNDGHIPDWDDRPRVRKIYGADGAIALTTLTGDDETALRRHLESMVRAITFRDRRIELSPNDRIGRTLSLQQPTYGRAASSGGGLYPVEFYLRTTGSAHLLPGTYYLDWLHKVLVPVSTGYVGEVSHHEILVSVRYWANSFKYGEFTHHVVSMDVGSLLFTFELLLAEKGILEPQIELVSGQDETRVALGLQLEEEDVYARIRISGDASSVPFPSVRGRTAEEKSAEVKTFPEFLQALQEGDLEGPKARTWHTEHFKTAAAGRAGFCRKLLETRHTSFGRFIADSLHTEQFHALGAAVSNTAEEITSALECGPIELYAIAWRIEGFNTGAVVRFSRTQQRWTPTGAEYTAEQVQDRYFLDNYDFGQVAAAIFPTVEPSQALSEGEHGVGYRALNAAIGAVAQCLYLSAAQGEFGCGAMLGFDNTGVGQSILPIPPSDLDSAWPYLMVAVGPEHRIYHRYSAPLKGIVTT